MSGLGGKERRVRELTRAGTSDAVLSGLCSGLFGVKGGADIQLGSSNWRVAPALGVAVNTRDTSYSSLLAEVEVNYWLPRGFVGSGLGGDDLTHASMRAPTWLVQGGVELWRSQNASKLLFVTEGRLFLDQRDDVANNYQFWGGLRAVLR